MVKCVIVLDQVQKSICIRKKVCGQVLPGKMEKRGDGSKFVFNFDQQNVITSNSK